MATAYNAHDNNVDHRDENCSRPLQLRSHGSSLDNDGNAIDNDLEQQLNFKHITE